ncbi:MAG: helix-turn-helix domain-containing protein [Acidimicrobiales bacterium]
MNELKHRRGKTWAENDESTGLEPLGVRTSWDPKRLGPLGSILGRKWTLTIIATLHDGPIRHGQLCRRLRPIARKVLHQSLDGLVDDGLVEKVVGIDDCGNIAVSYGLTPLGRSLHTVLDAMQAWTEHHFPVRLHPDATEPSESVPKSGSRLPRAPGSGLPTPQV